MPGEIFYDFLPFLKLFYVNLMIWHFTKMTITSVTFQQFGRGHYVLLLNWPKWYSKRCKIRSRSNIYKRHVKKFKALFNGYLFKFVFEKIGIRGPAPRTLWPGLGGCTAQQAVDLAHKEIIIQLTILRKASNCDAKCVIYVNVAVIYTSI